MILAVLTSPAETPGYYLMLLRDAEFSRARFTVSGENEEFPREGKQTDRVRSSICPRRGRWSTESILIPTAAVERYDTSLFERTCDGSYIFMNLPSLLRADLSPMNQAASNAPLGTLLSKLVGTAHESARKFLILRDCENVHGWPSGF